MAGIVLAGGRSRRMGRDKALIEWSGEPLLRRAVETVSSVVGPVVVVADRAGRYDLGDFPVIGDDQPGSGPLGGILTGLRHLGPGPHVVLACDMPLARPALLRLLLGRLDGRDAAVPQPDGGPEPLCAVYDARSLPVLCEAFDRGCRAVQRALDRLDVAWIDEKALRTADPDLVSFANVNDPNDLDRILSMDLARHV